ncbi:hypothetical protein B0H16DRAFT_1477172 [Mycena metata]|uniref:Uncharacterized protein n=1 Tax=Mycena metata TaxID=1033252 RepID=A0AAD7H9M8_9AGAR|nr:hypothetical protein B0H16DRAFT_1477172 [Mycena metata]
MGLLSLQSTCSLAQDRISRLVPAPSLAAFFPPPGSKSRFSRQIFNPPHRRHSFLVACMGPLRPASLSGSLFLDDQRLRFLSWVTDLTHLAGLLVASSFGASVGSAAAVSAALALPSGDGFHANAVRAAGFFGTLPSRPTDWNHDFFSRLPTELVVDVLSAACGSYHGSRRVFVRTRSAVALTPHRLVTDVRRWTSHWASGILDLKLKCDTLYSLIYRVSTASAPRMFPARTIAVLAPYFWRCSRLCLVLEDRTALPDVLQRLRRTRADFLTTFSLTRVTLPFSSVDILPVVCNPRRLFSPSTFPALTVFRACNASVGWGDLRYYAGLDDLIFIHLTWPVNPTTLKLYRILRRAARLLRLCMQRIQCEDLLDLPVPPVSLPRLRVLELDLDGSVGVACILAVCSMPALTSLSVNIGGDADLALLLQCAPSMRSVTSLAINGTAEDAALVTTLYLTFPLMLSLDLAHATPIYFQALYDPERRSPHMFPLLEELSVIDVTLNDVRLMLERRTSGPPLRHLTVHRGSQWDCVNALLWFLTNFTAEQFEVDPEPSLERPWFDDA